MGVLAKRLSALNGEKAKFCEKGRAAVMRRRQEERVEPEGKGLAFGWGKRASIFMSIFTRAKRGPLQYGE